MGVLANSLGKSKQLKLMYDGGLDVFYRQIITDRWWVLIDDTPHQLTEAEAREKYREHEALELWEEQNKEVPA